MASPRLIFELMRMSKKEEGCSEPAPPVMSRLEKKRKQGSGRTAFHKKRPDIVEAIKVFASNTGVGAQIRRRSEVGSMWFNISDVKEFLTDSFLIILRRLQERAHLGDFFVQVTRTTRLPSFTKDS